MADKKKTPSKTGGKQPKTSHEKKFGEIVAILLNEGLLSVEQAEYAARVRSKLPTPRSLLEVIKTLGYVNGEQIQQAIRSNKIAMRLGGLLVELGHISDKELAAASEIQVEEKSKRRLGEILVAHHFIEERKLVEVLSLQLGFPYVEPEFMEIDANLFNEVPGK
jgi:type IV pilus assembly protein PilB